MASTKSPTYPASKDNTMFFILTEKCSRNISSVEAGTLCYISEGKYLDRLKDLSPQRTIEVTSLDSSLSISSRVPVNALQPLTEHQAVLLYAVSDLAERWNCFQDRNTLEDAANAHVGQYVVVSVKEEIYPAIIRYIGKIHESSPLLKFFFGVELQDHGEGKGRSDGSYNHRHFFSCKTNCGLFVPFNRINFLTDRKYTEDEARSKVDEVAPINHGDTVGFYLEDEVKYGTVIHLEHQSSASETLVHVLLKEKDGSKSVMWAIPMDSIIKEELLSKEPKKTSNMAIAEKPLRQSSVESNNGKLEADSSDSCFLDVNSMVQLDLQNGHPASGIIRWTGFLDDLPYKMAGVELDEDKGFTDGTWKGKRYFECPPKRGIFVKQKACQPDMRFHSSSDALPLKADVFSGPTSPVVLENQPPLTNGMAVLVLKGTMKGIQGHCNSCYMDAALFSLFSCTSVLDSMLFMPANPADVPIQNILRDEIVNPLRQNGFVSANNVMKLRHHLTKESQCPSFATSEKDPEEFLNLIMHHILGIEPLLKLQSGMQKEQECYCYQIFMEKQEDMVVPDVQQLLAHSFLSSDLKLAEIPSCFIIQMPRFGKNYKMFSKIIPSLELDITDLLFESPRECIVCGELATMECPECFKDAMFSNALIKQYCEKCCTQAHTHYKRKGHKPRILKNPTAFDESTNHPHASRIPREKMELFAVLCIETSHYVSFVKYGPEKEDWMFFDSMADRYDENGGYNIPEVTLCPEVAKYLESPVADLAEKRPREMEGVAKRLFCDAYMYMYQSKKMALYK